MRGPTPQQMLQTVPPGLRMGARMTQAILDLRQKILTAPSAEYQAGQPLTAKLVRDTYGLNNIEAQVVLLRLAIEGLVKIQPVEEKTWPANAARNQYHVADLELGHRMFSNRQESSRRGYPATKETLELAIQYADQEIAALLMLSPGEPVVFHRHLQRSADETVGAICDAYLPFWFAAMMPEMQKPEYDVYQLMRQLGKTPFWCEETVDMKQASSVERALLGLSSDDPVGLLKIFRRSFDTEGKPLDLQYLTEKADLYRLHYTFPLFADSVPEAVRDK